MPSNRILIKDTEKSDISISLLPFGKFSPQPDIDDKNAVSHFYFQSNFETDFISLYKYDAKSETLTRRFTHDRSDISDVAHSRYGETIFWVRIETEFAKHYPAGELGKAILAAINPDKYEKIEILDVDKDNTVFLILRDSHIKGPRLEILNLASKQTIFVENCAMNKSLPWADADIIATQASDGTTIYSNIYRPKTASNGKTITYLHGGPSYKETLSWENLYFKSLTDKGYTVIAPNYRGSIGYGKAFRDGGRKNFDRARQDVLDIMTTVKSRKDIPQDAHILMGNSFGGYLAVAIATLEETPFEKVITRNGFFDIPEFIEAPVDIGRGKTRVYLRDSPVFGNIDDPTQRSYLNSVSPTHNVDTLNIPIFIAHARLDRKISYAQSSKFYKKLQNSGCRNQCQFVALNGGHAISDLKELERYIEHVDDFILNDTEDENRAIPVTNGAPFQFIKN